MARIELSDGSQPRIGVLVPETCFEDVMNAFDALQPERPWLQVSQLLKALPLQVKFPRSHGEQA